MAEFPKKTLEGDIAKAGTWIGWAMKQWLALKSSLGRRGIDSDTRKYILSGGVVVTVKAGTLDAIHIKAERRQGGYLLVSDYAYGGLVQDIPCIRAFDPSLGGFLWEGQNPSAFRFEAEYANVGYDMDCAFYKGKIYTSGYWGAVHIYDGAGVMLAVYSVPELIAAVEPLYDTRDKILPHIEVADDKIFLTVQAGFSPYSVQKVYIFDLEMNYLDDIPLPAWSNPAYAGVSGIRYFNGHLIVGWNHPSYASMEMYNISDYSYYATPELDATFGPFFGGIAAYGDFLYATDPNQDLINVYDFRDVDFEGGPQLAAQIDMTIIIPAAISPFSVAAGPGGVYMGAFTNNVPDDYDTTGVYKMTYADGAFTVDSSLTGWGTDTLQFKKPYGLEVVGI